MTRLKVREMRCLKRKNSDMDNELQLSDQQKLSHLKDIVFKGREFIMRAVADFSLINLDAALTSSDQDKIKEVIKLSGKSVDLLWELQESITKMHGATLDPEMQVKDSVDLFELVQFRNALAALDQALEDISYFLNTKTSLNVFSQAAYAKMNKSRDTIDQDFSFLRRVKTYVEKRIGVLK